MNALKKPGSGCCSKVQSYPQLRVPLILFFFFFFTGGLSAQEEGAFNRQTGQALSENELRTLLPDTFNLFGSEAPFELEIVSDFKELIKKKNRTEYQPAYLVYHPNEQVEIRRKIRVKARGNSRRTICYFPPLKLDFSKTEFYQTDLQDLDKIKMVSYCKKGKTYEDYHFREYLIYRMLNLLTPKSLRVRLIKMRYTDTGRKKNDSFDSFAFLIEDIDDLAARNHGEKIKIGRINDNATDPEQMDLVAVFQFMIANYDWSVAGRHNIKFIKVIGDDTPYPYAIPYDFDYCGLVNADYAIPPEELHVETVRTRLFRGYCRSREEYATTFQHFLDKREDLYALINDFPYLAAHSKKDMITYLDGFYRIIQNEGDYHYYFVENCRK